MARGAELNVEKDGLEISWWWADRTTLIVEFAGHLDNKTIARLALCASDICSVDSPDAVAAGRSRRSSGPCRNVPGGLVS
jgi:hypothetical protein